MNLEQFIKEALVQIANGILQADAAVSAGGGAVNPKNVECENVSGQGPYGYYAPELKDKMRRPVQCIEFDVVVTATEDQETKGGIGLHVGAIALGSSGKSGKGNASESRIKFAIPFLMPNSKSA